MESLKTEFDYEKRIKEILDLMKLDIKENKLTEDNYDFFTGILKKFLPTSEKEKMRNWLWLAEWEFVTKNDIDPLFLLKPIMYILNLEFENREKALRCLKGHNAQTHRKKFKDFSDKDEEMAKEIQERYRKEILERKEEKINKITRRKKRKIVTINSIISEVYGVAESNSRFDSCRMKYYRALRKMGKCNTKSNNLFGRIVDYLNDNSSIVWTEDDDMLTHTIKYGNARTIYDAAINEETYKRKCIEATQKQLLRRKKEREALQEKSK